MSTTLRFTDAEADLLGRTADALSAYTGKPIIAEIVTNDEAGYEWVLVARPLTPEESVNDTLTVQAGGQGARFLGNLGGLSLDHDDPLECELLWAIQLSDLEGVRYIKVDHHGEEVAWTNVLTDVLPFALDDTPIDDPDDDPDDEDDKDED
ncbi:MAG: hypothetical protein L0H54_12345 [Alcaligenaceae bacterium]|nr:hypothetical protein [Alcaligenaceae bacterium]